MLPRLADAKGLTLEGVSYNYDREQCQERNYEQWAYDLLDDAVLAFHNQPFVTVA